METKEIAKLLTENHHWDELEATKLWCFGPDTTGTNILVDKTYQVQNIREIKESMETGF